jgi:hypothetical protein
MTSIRNVFAIGFKYGICRDNVPRKRRRHKW